MWSGGIKPSINPNPTTGSFKIDMVLPQSGMIAIYDLSGKLVYSEQFNSSESLSIDLPDSMTSGTYIVLLQTDQSVFQHQLILK